MEIKIKKLDERAVIPAYAHAGDMCMDLTAVSFEYDRATDCLVYHTGLAVEIPEGYGMLVFPRSSNRKTECYLPNHVGVIDSGYRGEILVCFKARDGQNRIVPYAEGDRVAQVLILPYPVVKFIEVKSLDGSERGTGGFGSTGR